MNVLYLMRLLVYFVCFAGCLYALSALDYARFLRKNANPAAAQLLYIFLAMAFAYLLGQFLMGIMVSFQSIAPSGEVTLRFAQGLCSVL